MSLATIALHNLPRRGHRRGSSARRPGSGTCCTSPAPFASSAGSSSSAIRWCRGWRSWPWLLLGPLFRLDPPARQRILVRTGCAAHPAICHRPRAERLRRSGAVVTAALDAVHCAVIPEHVEVSAVARLSPDDDRARPCSPWPGSIVVNLDPRIRSSSSAACRSSISCCTSTWRTSRPWSSRGSGTARRRWPFCFIRCRRWAARGHCFLLTSGTTSGSPMPCGPSSCGLVSRVPVVCRRQGAPARLVAELPVSSELRRSRTYRSVLAYRLAADGSAHVDGNP